MIKFTQKHTNLAKKNLFFLTDNKTEIVGMKN